MPKEKKDENKKTEEKVWEAFGAQMTVKKTDNIDDFKKILKTLNQKQNKKDE